MEFRFSNSVPAVIIGGILALGIAAWLISSGRPWFAAAWGAVTWSLIGFFVGLLGKGSLTILPAMFYAAIGAPLGAVVAGIGASANAQQPSTEKERNQSSDKDD